MQSIVGQTVIQVQHVNLGVSNARLYNQLGPNSNLPKQHHDNLGNNESMGDIQTITIILLYRWKFLQSHLALQSGSGETPRAAW